MKVKTSKLVNILFSLLLLSLGFGMVYINIGFALKPYMIVTVLIFSILLITKQLKLKRLLIYEKGWLIFALATIVTIVEIRYFSENIRYIQGFGIILIYYVVLSNLLSIITKEDIENSISKVGIIISIVTLGYYVLGLIECGFNFYGNGQQYYGLLIDRGSPRLVSLMSDDPNITSVYITIYFFFYISKLKENTRNKMGLILTTIILLLTFSRGAYISIALVLLINLILEKGMTLAKKIKLIIKTLIVGIILLQIVNIFSGINIFDTIFGRFESSTSDNGSGRLVLWGNAIKTFVDNPITGIGINSTLKYNYIKYGTVNYVHNTYLEVLSETGIIGTIPYILFIVGILIVAFNNYKKNGKDMFLLTTVLALLFQMIFLSVLLNEMIYTCIAILAKYYIDNNKENKLTTKTIKQEGRNEYIKEN